MKRPSKWLLAAGALAAIAWLASIPASREAGRLAAATLAVLPFADGTGTGGGQYFGDGIAADLIDRLDRSRDLRVIGRESGFLFRGRARDTREIRRRLGAGKLLEGVVRQAGVEGIVIARFVDTGGRAVWEREYRGAADAIEAGIVQAVARTLGIGIPHQDPDRNPVAGDLCMRARHALRQRDAGSLTGARVLIDSALRAAPAYAPAYAALGEWEYASAQAGTADYRAAMAASRESLRRAVELDPSLASARVRLGTIELAFFRDRSRARQELQAAVLAAPGMPAARTGLGFLDCLAGRSQACVEEVRAAAALDPLSASAALELALSLYFARQYSAAVRQCDAVLAQTPGAAVAYYRRGWAHAAAGENEPALRDAASLAGLRAPELLYRPLRGFALARSGRAAEAKAEIDALRNSGSRNPDYAIAVVFLGLGDREACLRHLGRAAELPDPYLPYLAADPLFEGLTGDPRFAEIAGREGASH